MDPTNIIHNAKKIVPKKITEAVSAYQLRRALREEFKKGKWCYLAMYLHGIKRGDKIEIVFANDTTLDVVVDSFATGTLNVFFYDGAVLSVHSYPIDMTAAWGRFKGKDESVSNSV